MTQSEKEIVEAIKENFSFEDETEQSCGLTVNENKAIKMFNSTCRFDKEEQKYIVSPLFRDVPPRIQTNFHIASTMLRRLMRRLNMHEILQSKGIVESTTNDPLNIKWVTSAPQAPNTNAVNEVLIRISKTAFKKDFQKRYLDRARGEDNSSISRTVL